MLFYEKVITGVLLSLAVGFSGCGSKEERLAEHFNKGKAFYAESNFDKARLEMRNVLKIDPKHAEAYYVVGQIEEHERAWPKAFANYSKAMEVDPGHLAAKAKVGKFHLVSGETEKAEKLASEILAANPQHVAGRTLKAAITSRKGDTAKGIAEAEAVFASAPNDSDAAALLASFYVQNKQPDRAQAVLEKTLQSNGDIGLRFELIRIALGRNDLKSAEQQYKSVIVAEPKIFSHRQSLALFYHRTKRIAEAEATLREAIKVVPDDHQRYLVLAQFLAAGKRFDEADKELAAGVAALPKAYQLRFAQVELAQGMNKPDKARKLLNEIIELDKEGQHGLAARNQLARIALTGGDIATATKYVAEVIKESPRDNDALVLRSYMALAAKNYASAISDLRTVLKDQPDSLDVIERLAKTHMANREPQLAKETFSNAVGKFAENVNLRLAYAQFLARTGDIESALKQLDEALKRAPKDARIVLAKAEIEAVKKDWAAAEATTASLKEIQPGQAFPFYRLGLIYLAQGKTEPAIGEFQKAVAIAPAAIEPLSAIVNAYMRQNNPTEALARIEAGLKASPNNVAILQLKSEVYLAQQKVAEAESVLRQAMAVNPKASISYLSLSRLALRQGNAAAATQLLQQGLAAIPGDTELTTALAQVYQITGKHDEAIAQYESVLKREPMNFLVANNLASLISDIKGDKANLEKALRIATPLEATGNPNFIDTLGWIYFKLGQMDNSIRLLRQVVERAPKIPIFEYHLGMALYKKGDLAAAKQHLQLAVDSKDKYLGLEEAKATLAKIAG